jgi:hypothetical protein
MRRDCLARLDALVRTIAIGLGVIGLAAVLGGTVVWLALRLAHALVPG